MEDRISIKEFREKGYLQELNRRFLHPLGLALEIVIDKDGSEYLGGIWDYRGDTSGIHYDLKNSSSKRKMEFKNKYSFIENEIKYRKKERVKRLGFWLEKIK
jgi:hypothetical protein